MNPFRQDVNTDIKNRNRGQACDSAIFEHLYAMPYHLYLLMVINRKRVLGILFVALLAGCAASAFGQEKIEISTDPPPAVARFPVVREVGSAKVSSWAAKNQLISESAFLGTKLSEDERINVKARFVSEGK